MNAISSRNRASLSYLLTFGIVAFTRYSIYPWLLLHIQSRKYESWAQAVVSYGALLTFLNLGIAIGQSAANYSKQLTNKFFMIVLLSLISSYVGLAFVTRFAMMGMSIFSIGFSGALVSGFSLSLDKGSPSLIHRKNRENDPNRSLDRGVICFTFATLLGSILYDARAFVNYPAFYLAMFLGSAFFIMLVYYLVLANAVAQKSSRVNVIGRGGRGEGSGTIKGTGRNMDLRSSDTDIDAGIEYTGDVPLNFLSCCRGDLQKARKMYGKMLSWRKSYDLDNIFQQPQRFFKEILEFYPHGIHGYSLDGCGVVYEVLGRGNPSGLAKTGIEIDELVWHFNIRNELVFRKLCDPVALEKAAARAPPGAITITPFPYLGNSDTKDFPAGVMKQPIPRLMTVIDVQGISITSVTTQVISFIKKSGEIIDNYYPEQVARLVVCRAPRWFSTIWTVIARVLPEAVQKKVDILYDAKGLDKYIHPSQRPREYGGTDVDLGEWEGHKMFVQISEEWKRQTDPSIKTDTADISTEGSLASSNGQSPKPGKEIPSSSFQQTPKLLSTTALTSENTNNNASSTSNNRTNKGVMSWLTDRFSSSNKPTTAYLGEKNSYRYNASTGMWELDADYFYDNSDQSEGVGRSSGGGQTGQSLSSKNNMPPHSEEENSDDEIDGTADMTPLDSQSRSQSGEATVAAGTSSFNASGSSKINGRRRKIKEHLSQEQIEEHGLVLAIQAAHYASQYSAAQQRFSQSNLNLSSLPMTASYGNLDVGLNSPSASGRLSLEREYPGNTGRGFDSESGSGGGGGSVSGSVNSTGNNVTSLLNPNVAMAKLSSSIFLIVILIFVLTTSMQMMLTTLLPVWLCAPLKSGGLGYNVRDLGLQLSCCGLLILHAHLFFGGKFDHILRASPVRALRIGAAGMCFALFVLPLYARWFTVPLEDILHHSGGHESSHFGLDETEQRTTSLWRWHHHNMQAMLQEAESAVLASLQGLSPTTSIISLLVCAVLISTLMVMAQLCRKASGMLLHLVLSAVFQNPGNIRNALYSLADVLGPLLSCVVYSVVYSSHIRFPLNSSFFFPFSASMAVLSYCLSIFLVVHFRGDYGLMNDYQDWRSPSSSLSWFNSAVARQKQSSKNSKVASASNNSMGGMNKGRSSDNRVSGGQGLSQRHGTGNNTFNNANSESVSERNRSSSTDSFSEETMPPSLSHSALPSTNNEANDHHLLAIPLGDLNLLFSAVGYGYGSKLYNLKDDFKDV